MRFATIDGRASLLHHERALDIYDASGGVFSSNMVEALERWDDLKQWALDAPFDDAVDYDPVHLGAPVEMPRQVFAIGLNYPLHAQESRVTEPDEPLVFTKFPTSIVGPNTTIELPSASVDWEIELVVVIGRRAQRVPVENAWDYVAGLTIGQDLTDRAVQMVGPAPQFCMGKSFPGFGPIGPAFVTIDEFDNPDALAITCSVDGEILQDGNTRQMIFGVAQLISKLSNICPMLPGDLLFTGTPDGVGMARHPARYLDPGTTLISEIEGIGELCNQLVKTSE